MKVTKSFSLEDDFPIASMKKNPTDNLISIGSENGYLTLINSENSQNKILVDKDVCLVDHAWINDT